MANILKNPILIKAAIVSLVVVVLNALGFAILQFGNVGLSISILGLALVTNFIVLGILSVGYDLVKGKKLYKEDALVGGLVGGVVLTGFSGALGITAGNFIVIFLVVAGSLLVGYRVGDEIKQ